MAGKKFSEAVAEYMVMRSNKKGSNSRTVKNDGEVLGLVQYLLGDRVLANITPDHIEAVFYGPGGLRDDHKVRTSRGKTQTSPAVAPSTHNHYRSRLSTFFKWCQMKRYLKDAAWLMSQTEALPVQRQPRMQPNPALLLSLPEQAKNARDRCFLALAINTGLRSNEISKIKCGQVNLDQGWLENVVISKTGVLDEGLPITLELDQELRRWITQYSVDLGRELHEDDYLFPRRRGGLIASYEKTEDGMVIQHRQPYVWVPDTPVHKTHVIVQGALRAVGLPTFKEGTHTLRRAVARAYFDAVSQEKGDVAALRETAALLHHSNTATTEIYLGLTPEKNARDRRLRGQPFLSALVPSQDNVVPLRATGTGENA